MRLHALVIVLACGCRMTGTFVCETSDQCRSAQGPGVCDPDTSYCTFADADCASGTRFADNAGEGLAGHCTGEQPPADAMEIDAAPFDTSQCPAKFDQTLASQPNAKFYLDITNGTYGVVAKRCLDELQGATHPANIHSAASIPEIAALFNFGGPAWIFVGVIQDPSVSTPIGGWINFDGSAFDATLWTTAAPTQPDDLNGSEADHAEQAGAVEYTGRMGDYDGTFGIPLLCACDGVPVDPRAVTFLNANTW